MKIDQSEIYKKMVMGLVTIFPLIEEDVGMMLDELLKDTAQAIVDLDPWVSVDEGLPESNVKVGGKYRAYMVKYGILQNHHYCAAFYISGKWYDTFTGDFINFVTHYDPNPITPPRS